MIVLVDFGDVDETDSGGVGIDTGSAPLDDPAGLTDFVLLRGTIWEVSEEVDAADEESLKPHEARTLFSTLTVSSLNINDSWSLYPGHALDNRTHCVHSGCLLSHYVVPVSGWALDYFFVEPTRLQQHSPSFKRMAYRTGGEHPWKSKDKRLALQACKP